MSIVFAASLPHTPMLIPRIGQDHANMMHHTHKAFREIADRLLKTRADSLVIVSGHGDRAHIGLTIHLRPSHPLSFENFGDFDTKLNVPGDVALANAIKHPFDTKRQDMPMIITSSLPLDYGISTPLFALNLNGVNLKTLPLQLRFKKPGPEYEIGERLRSSFVEYPGRLAVIVSANLSHRLSASSPAGISPRARAFDKRVIENIISRNHQSIKRLRLSTLDEVQPCGLGALLFMLGLISGAKHEVRLISYEHPFGIGLPVFLFT